MKLYRKMLMDNDGQPMVGNGPSLLGVRLANPANPKQIRDVDAATGADPVRPGKGMSVDTSPVGIPPHVEGVLWAIEESAIPLGLAAPQRGKRPTHHQIEPVAEMTLDEYQSLLWGTRSAWVRVPDEEAR